MTEKSFLILGQPRPGFDECVQFVNTFSSHIEFAKAPRTDPLPAICKSWEGDVLISYMSGWVIPQDLLRRVKIAAINFHPGPPAYPGTGCTNFAIYDGAKEYGVTAHHMNPSVDSGAIIAVRRFPLSPQESVLELTQKCYEHLRHLCEDVLRYFFSKGKFPESDEQWSRKAYTRTELEELCHITPDMPKEEVKRRIQATTYPGKPGAYMQLHGYRFDWTQK